MGWHGVLIGHWYRIFILAHSQFDCPERETEKEVGELGFNVSGAVSHVGKGMYWLASVSSADLQCL